MKRQAHWSRKPDKIRRDTEFLSNAGLTFKKDTSGFHKICPSKLKENLLPLQIEAEFDCANDPEHQYARKIWDKNIEELRGA